MRIAMMDRGFIPAPRPLDIINASVNLAVAISEGLVKRGHTVDYFGPLGTALEFAHVESLNLRALVRNQKEFHELFDDTDKIRHAVPDLWDKYLAGEMFRRAKRGKYDLLHFHHPESVLALAGIYSSVPIVYTLHDAIYPWYRELFELYQTPNQHFISISNNQRRDAPDLPYVANVYNGIDLQQCPFSDKPENYLLFVGRIVEEKGVKEAIQIAKQTGDRLLIIGPTYPETQGYFDQYIKPQLNDQILYLGFIEQSQLWRYYQKAKAFLTPVQWEEPFGMTTIEAMACGTPVISLRRGAVAEIVKDGKTGYVVDSIAEMVAAVGKIDTIQRATCRDHVKQYFSVETMVDGYQSAYEKILRKRSPTLKGKTFVTQRLLHPKPLQKFHSGLPAATENENQLGLEV